jgi:hypothetical protein
VHFIAMSKYGCVRRGAATEGSKLMGAVMGVEALAVVVALVAALTYPQFGASWFAKAERVFVQLANRRWLSVMLCGALALALRAALLPIEPIPKPVVHDEFGYLLAADTFSRWRLTNPPHPMWEHFETFSVLQRPTYQSYAPPAQGIILAVGKLALGHPFGGVWLSLGALAAAICWMLQAWLESGWALLGGFLVVLRFATFGYWANSYWGGAVGAIGGALVLGALPRVKQSQNLRDVSILALGLLILATSRPYEGFIFSVPVAVALCAWVVGKKSPPFRVTFRRVVIPLTLMLGVMAIAMGYYFWRITGSPFRTPYQVERSTYAYVPLLISQPLQPALVHRHPVIEKMYRDEVGAYWFARSGFGFGFNLLRTCLSIWKFFLGPVLTVPMLMLIAILPYGLSWKQVNPSTRLLLAIVGMVLAGLSLELSLFSPHYVAPLTCVILTLVLKSMQQLRSWQWHGKPTGLFLTRAVSSICVALFLLRILAAPFHIPLPRSHAPAWYEVGPREFGRTQMIAQLSSLAGDHLVIVRYAPDHNYFAEWVYNEAEIDKSKVVWARDMGEAENENLTKYFSNRRTWVLDADAKPPRLLVYDPRQLVSNRREKVK